MRQLTRAAAGLIGAIGLSAALAVPANAALSIDSPITSVTQELTPGKHHFNTELKNIKVTDTRGVNTGWNASIHRTAYVNNGNFYTPPFLMYYLSHPSSVVKTGTNVSHWVPPQYAMSSPDTKYAMMKVDSSSGNNTVSWTGELKVVVDSNATAGTITTTLVMSVI